MRFARGRSFEKKVRIGKVKDDELVKVSGGGGIEWVECVTSGK